MGECEIASLPLFAFRILVSASIGFAIRHALDRFEVVQILGFQRSGAIYSAGGREIVKRGMHYFFDNFPVLKIYIALQFYKTC